MKHLVFAVLALALVAGSATAQDLTVTVTGDFANGGSVDWSLTGAPADAPTVVLASMDDTGLSVGMLLTLDIGPVVVPVAFGNSDANGDFSTSRSFGPLPPQVVSNFAPLTFHSQAVSLAGGIGGGMGGGPGGGGFSPMFAISDAETATIN